MSIFTTTDDITSSAKKRQFKFDVGDDVIEHKQDHLLRLANHIYSGSSHHTTDHDPVQLSHVGVNTVYLTPQKPQQHNIPPQQQYVQQHQQQTQLQLHPAPSYHNDMMDDHDISCQQEQQQQHQQHQQQQQPQYNINTMNDNQQQAQRTQLYYFSDLNSRSSRMQAYMPPLEADRQSRHQQQQQMLDSDIYPRYRY